jgi:hypothetical protein
MFPGKLDICMQRLKLDPCFSPYTNINSKNTKDFNLRPETLTLIQQRAESTLELISISSNFLHRTPMAQQLRERIDKWDHIKLKSFCTEKEVVTRLKR